MVPNESDSSKTSNSLKQITQLSDAGTGFELEAFDVDIYVLTKTEKRRNGIKTEEGNSKYPTFLFNNPAMNHNSYITLDVAFSGHKLRPENKLHN